MIEKAEGSAGIISEAEPSVFQFSKFGNDK